HLSHIYDVYFLLSQICEECPPFDVAPNTPRGRPVFQAQRSSELPPRSLRRSPEAPADVAHALIRRAYPTVQDAAPPPAWPGGEPLPAAAEVHGRLGARSE